MEGDSVRKQRKLFAGARAAARALVALILLVLLLAGGVAAWLWWRARACLPQLDGTIRVAGLGARVEALRDAHGVPHIRAQTVEDLFFAQGYVTAQDRLWQMDLNRRLAAGELSEIFGDRTLKLDIENRTLGLHWVEEEAVQELDEESHHMLSAYSRGVNAFISTHLSRLPIEFVALRYQPRPWKEADSVGVALNMAKSLSTSWPNDLMHARICARIPPELCADLFPDHSSLDRPVATSIANPKDESRRPPLPRPSEIGEVDPAIDPIVLFAANSLASLGSNNWVVSGKHAQAGKPLLANDPHLGHSVPSIWYMLHLKCPGMNVTGVSFPGLPTVIIGHNDRIAWGVTNTGSDVQDLYVETFDQCDPTQYLHNRNWVKVEVRDEVIKVRGKADYHLQVKVTRHGPVVSRENGRALALQWTALKPRAFSFPFRNIDRARNWGEFVTALRSFSCPMQNFVYADIDGNIGYYAPGLVPIRRKGDGTVPVDGSTDEYDWVGYIPFEDLPHDFNPSSGMIATANGRIVPDEYPYLISRSWAEPYRTARIYQMLETGREFNVSDMLRIQSDISALYDAWLAQQIVAAAAQRPPQTDDPRLAVGVLSAWDGKARADSAAPLITSVTHQALLERLLGPKLGDEWSTYSSPMATVFVQNVLNNRWTRWLPPGDSDLRVTVVKSLEAGMRRIPELLEVTDHNAWRWGNTISLTFRHPLGGLPLLGRVLNFGPFPQSGTRTTVKPGIPSSGASMRMVVDLANLDDSVQNITLGQSGQVLSPYFCDQFDAWYTGQSLPMLFSDSMVEKGAVHRLVLEPAN